MNFKEIYDGQTLGKLEIDRQGKQISTKPSPESEYARQVAMQQKQAWLEHPETLRFLTHLQQKLLSHLECAENIAITGDELEVRSALVQYRTTKEIINYARNIDNGSPKSSNINGPSQSPSGLHY